MKVKTLKTPLKIMKLTENFDDNDKPGKTTWKAHKQNTHSDTYSSFFLGLLSVRHF